MTEGLNSYAGRKGLPVTFKVMMWREIAGNSALKFKKKKKKSLKSSEEQNFFIGIHSPGAEIWVSRYISETSRVEDLAGKD